MSFGEKLFDSLNVSLFGRRIEVSTFLPGIYVNCRDFVLLTQIEDSRFILIADESGDGGLAQLTGCFGLKQCFSITPTAGAKNDNGIGH